MIQFIYKRYFKNNSLILRTMVTKKRIEDNECQSLDGVLKFSTGARKDFKKVIWSDYE